MMYFPEVFRINSAAAAKKAFYCNLEKGRVN